MDRPPEDPTPDDPAPDDEPGSLEETPPEPASPYGPQTDADAGVPTTPGGSAPPARPYEWKPLVEGKQPAPDAPPAVAYPPGPPAAPEGSRPGVGAGVATGCGLQVLAFVLFFVTAGLALGVFGALWPFILVTVGSALLMLSQRWRRFATGALIVCVATWIIVIGPCIALLNGL